MWLIIFEASQRKYKRQMPACVCVRITVPKSNITFVMLTYVGLASNYVSRWFSYMY